MIHVSDIEVDLGRNDARGIEDAFRALVGYPKEDEIKGAKGADHLSDLLHRCAIAMEIDESLMPSGTADLFNDLMNGELVRDAWTGTYSAGSTVAREHKEHFRAIFSRAYRRCDD